MVEQGFAGSGNKSGGYDDIPIEWQGWEYREKAFVNIDKFKVKMKTTFILGSLAATFVGCSNEELDNVASNDFKLI